MSCLPVLQGDDVPLSDEVPERIYLSMQEAPDGITEEDCLAGVIYRSGFADENDTNIIAEYERKAREMSELGVGLLWLSGLATLREARLAVIGARKSGLPLYAVLAVGEEVGESSGGSSLLACFLCLQGLGVKALGLSGTFERIDEEIPKLLPYTSVELVASPIIDRPADMWNMCMRWLFESGIRGIGLGRCGDDIGDSTALMCGLYDRMAVKLPARPEDTPILLADSRNVFYIEEDFTLSEPIECEVDMLASFVEQEDAGFDALLIEIRDRADAENFAANRDMPRAAICFLTDDAEALELCLQSYIGRALVDARSAIPEDELIEIAGRYSAMIR